MEDMFSQYEQRQAEAPQQPPRPIPQTALALKEPSRTRQIAITALMLCLLGGLSVLGWYAMEEGKGGRDVAELPVIQANTEPYKQEPENPGGIEIPDKDRMVFNTISSREGDHKDVIDAGIAQLTPAPEQPATPEQVAQATGAAAEGEAEAASVEPAAGENITSPTIPPAPSAEVEHAAEAADKGTEAEIVAETVETKPEATEAALVEKIEQKKPEETVTETVAAPNVESAAPEVAPETITATRPAGIAEEKVEEKVEAKPAVTVIHVEEEKPAVSSKKAKAAKAAAKTSTKSFRVQLGAFKSEKSLETGWASLKKKFPKELGKLHRAIEVADLGEKGTFYRLHAGSLPSSAAAQKVCDKLKAKNQGCIVAK